MNKVQSTSTRKGAEHASNVLDGLLESPRPLSAYDLLDRLRPKGVSAPLLIYLALEKLMQAGKVGRIQSLNAVVPCRGSEGHDHDHDRTMAFAICGQCGSLDEFDDAELRQRIGVVLAAKSFVPHTSAIEVYGVCGRCGPKV